MGKKYDPLILLRRVGIGLALWLVLTLLDKQFHLGIDQVTKGMLSTIVGAVSADTDAYLGSKKGDN